MTLLPRSTTALTVLCALALAPIAAPAHAIPSGAEAPADPTAAGGESLAAGGTDDVASGNVAASSVTPAAVTTSAVSTASANDRIARVLPGRSTSSVLGSDFTMTVWDTETRSYVFRQRAKQSQRGASTMKVLTSVAALATLGPDHRMPTRVMSGETDTELILVGGGDPLLSSANLRGLARRTAAALEAQHGAGSVPKITLRADDSLFKGTGMTRGWYSHWVPSQVRRVGAFARDDRKVSDATADVGQYFATKLRANDIRVTYAGEGRSKGSAAEVAAYQGHRIGKAVSHALLVSDNDTAEMLFRQVAVGRGVKPSFPGARQAVRDTLTELSIPLKGVEIVDGSGLSIDGRITAPALTVALKRALSAKHPDLAGIPGWLPVAGAATGTLQADYKRFTTWPSKCAAGLVTGKTGTLADAISLAGYATGADGKTKIYAAIVNHRPTAYSRLTTRQAVDRPVSSITGCW